MDIKIKKLYPEAKIPTRGTVGSAGWDFYALTDADYIGAGVYRPNVMYQTGISLEIPSGHVGLIFPRSSIYKTDLNLSNSVGVIDSDFRGEIKFIFKRPHTRSVEYKAGDRIGQLVIIPYPEINFVEVDDLSDTKRGSNGFGSTGGISGAW